MAAFQAEAVNGLRSLESRASGLRDDGEKGACSIIAEDIQRFERSEEPDLVRGSRVDGLDVPSTGRSWPAARNPVVRRRASAPSRKARKWISCTRFRTTSRSAHPNQPVDHELLVRGLLLDHVHNAVIATRTVNVAGSFTGIPLRKAMYQWKPRR